MKLKIKTPYNGLVTSNHHEAVTELPSLTIPDQTLTVKQLMDRFSRGLPLDGAKIPVYHGDEFIPDFEKMDLVDKHAAMEANAERIKEMQQQLQFKFEQQRQMLKIAAKKPELSESNEKPKPDEKPSGL